MLTLAAQATQGATTRASRYSDSRCSDSRREDSRADTPTPEQILRSDSRGEDSRRGDSRSKFLNTVLLLVPLPMTRI